MSPPSCLLRAQDLYRLGPAFRLLSVSLPCLSPLSLSLSLSLPPEAVQEQLKVDQYSEGGTGMAASAVQGP